jgi:hypothetical protein
MNRNNCSAHYRLSKQTLLAMVNAQTGVGFKVGERVEYTDAQGRTTQQRISAVLAETLVLENDLVVSKTNVKAAQRHLLDKVPLESWTITSFDPKTHLACIDLETRNGKRHFSITLPIFGRN